MNHSKGLHRGEVLARPITWPNAIGNLALAAALVGCGVDGASAEDRPAPKSKASSRALDNDLLQDLPVRSAPGTPPGRSGEDAAPQSSPPAAKSDEGEDLERVGPDEFLRDIQLRMRRIEQRLRSQDVSRSTQAEQQRIAADLADFIAQLQQIRGQGEKPKDGGSGSATQQPGQANAKPKEGRAVESGDRDKPEGPRERESVEAMLERGGMWGALPPQLRQQLQGLTNDKFLPQYERLIQQYYRRLAEPQTTERRP